MKERALQPLFFVTVHKTLGGRNENIASVNRDFVSLDHRQFGLQYAAQ